MVKMAMIKHLNYLYARTYVRESEALSVQYNGLEQDKNFQITKNPEILSMSYHWGFGLLIAIL